MEFLFYFLCGILYTEIVLIEISLILGITFLTIKSLFLIFEKLNLDNPFIKINKF